MNKFLEKHSHLGIQRFQVNKLSLSAFERYKEMNMSKFKTNYLNSIKKSVKKRSKMLNLEKELALLAVESVAKSGVSSKNKKKTKKGSITSKAVGEKSKKSSSKLSTEENKTSVSGSAASQEEEVQFSIFGLSEDEARKALWKHLAKKQIPKLVRSIHQGTSARLFNCKKLAQATAGLVKRQNGRLAGKPVTAARRAMKEMLAFWKKNEREERDLRKRAEREAAERRRIEEEQREARRQAKKLNFLITQTELYSHFVGRKQKETSSDASNTTAALSKDMDFADVDDSVIHAEAERIAKNAAAAHQAKLEQFQQPANNETKDNEIDDDAGNDMDFMNPSTLKDAIILEQPTLMQVSLKSYQLKGLTWLASLYEQVLNIYN